MNFEVNREIHLLTLENLLKLSATSFIFINGPADCGKTNLLQSATNFTGISALYIDSLECITMTILYERLLSFVTNNLNTNNYNTTTRSLSKINQSLKPCSTITELVNRLCALNWPNDFKVILLIDEVDRFLQLDSNALSVLLRLPEILDQKITLVIASRENFDDFGPTITNGLIPIRINLPSFSGEEIKKIIFSQILNLQNTKNHQIKQKIEASINIVQQVANYSCKELSVLRNLTISLLNKTLVSENNFNQNQKERYETGKLPKLVQERLEASNRLDFYYKQTISTLNLIEKFILISSFIASFQTARDDLKIFGTSENNLSKKKIKRMIDSSDLIVNNNKTNDKLIVQLPKLFDQTRLMSIFYFLIENLEILPSPQKLQIIIRSLCDRGLLKSVTGAKIDLLKYRVNISKDFALNISEGLGIDLKKLSVTLL